MDEKERTAVSSGSKTIPKDLLVIAVWLILAVASIYIPVVNETFIRVILTVPVILFIPGYVLIAR